MEKVIKFKSNSDYNRTTIGKNQSTTVIIREEIKVISFSPKSAMNEMETYQRILSLYKKEY